MCRRWVKGNDNKSTVQLFTPTSQKAKWLIALIPPLYSEEEDKHKRLQSLLGWKQFRRNLELYGVEEKSHQMRHFSRHRKNIFKETLNNTSLAFPLCVLWNAIYVFPSAIDDTSDKKGSEASNTFSYYPSSLSLPFLDLFSCGSSSLYLFITSQLSAFLSAHLFFVCSSQFSLDVWWRWKFRFGNLWISSWNHRQSFQNHPEIHLLSTSLFLNVI